MEKSKQQTRCPSKSQGCEDRDIQGSSTEEDRWLGYLWNQKELGKEISNEVDRRDEQQRQADERKVIPGSTYKALTEESYQEKVEAGITALNHTATRVPINTDKAIRNLMHACNRNAMQQISKVVHKEHGMAKVTICLCRECYNNFTGREEITFSQFRNMCDSTMKKHMSNSMFVHLAVGTVCSQIEKKKEGWIGKEVRFLEVCKAVNLSKSLFT